MIRRAVMMLVGGSLLLACKSDRAAPPPHGQKPATEPASLASLDTMRARLERVPAAR